MGRAISDVVATLILAAIIVSMATALYIYWLGTYSNLQFVGESSVIVQREGALERFIIVDVWFVNGDSVVIDVYNFGGIEVTITDVYINGTLVEDVEGLEYVIPVGGFGSFKAHYVYESGRPYIVKVVSERGNSDEVLERA